VAESSEWGKGKGRAEPSTWPPTHINATVVTRALEEFQSHFIERQERNVPLCFLKTAKWFDQPDRDGYYCHYKDEGWKHVEFSLKFLVWINLHVKDQKYFTWQIAGGQLEIMRKNNWYHVPTGGPIDGAVDPTSEPENINVQEPQSDPLDDERSEPDDINIPQNKQHEKTKLYRSSFHTLKPMTSHLQSLDPSAETHTFCPLQLLFMATTT